MSFDDLLGVEEPRTQAPALSPYGRRLGRPKGSKNPVTAADVQREELHLGMKDAHHVIAGVSVTWLEKIFRMNRDKIMLALTNCKPIGTGRNGGPIYDVKTAAAYLVDPVKDVDQYLLSLDPKRMPQRLQEGYWNARIKEMKARVMAGELWPTDKVLEVLGDTFQTIKSTIQLWADTVEEETGEMTPEQRDYLLLLSDKLLDEIHKSLVTQARNKATPSWAAELDAD